MARNIRTIGVKGYIVNYAVVDNGKMIQNAVEIETASEAKIMRKLAKAHGVDASKVAIISVEEFTTNYRILDIVKALKELEKLDLAEIVSEEETEEETK